MPLGARPSLVRNPKVEATWLSLLTDPPISHSDINNWRPTADVRPSSFPFCPRRYVLERLGLQVPSTFVVESNYYTETGKAAHYVGQNALARTGRLWGFWTCARPSCKRLFAQEPSFLPDETAVCQHCGANVFEYDELVVEDKGVKLRGHTDGVLVFKRHSAVLEIKTASDEKVTKLRAASDEEVSVMFQTESPWYGYHHQASTYASLLRLKYPELPPIREVIYLVFSRNSPRNVASFTMPVPEDDSWWLEIRARIKMAQEAAARKTLPVGYAETPMDISALPSCTWCQYRELCLQPAGLVRYEADALYDQSEREALDTVLQEARAHHG